VKNGYDNPARLGCDRWAALVAARRREPGPCLVVTVGTAMTVDALSGKGEFLGGLIVPGPALMLQALVGNTGQLGPEAGTWRAFPANTADAMTSGALTALAGAAAQQRQRLQEREGVAPALLLSGGGATLLKSLLPGPVVEVDNLVLEGLVIIAEESCH
jgi:type III pantothenate kinase